LSLLVITNDKRTDKLFIIHELIDVVIAKTFYIIIL